MKSILAIATGVGLYALPSLAEAEECGDVAIAEMNWASAGIAAQVDKIILESGYGCSVQIVAGDTIPTFNAMNGQGQPDLAPEFWINSVRQPLDLAVQEGRLIQGAEILADGAVEGWWIPKFVADAHPDIKTVTDALKHPELFPSPAKENRAAIYNCPAAWSCQVSTANLYRAVGAEEKGFDLIAADTADDLNASIARAFEEERGWLGYYWAPTPIMGKYPMVKLSFGVPHNRLDWETCTAVAACPSPKVNSYPISQAFTVATQGFASKAGVALNYVKARKWTNATVNSILAWQEEHRGSNEDAARYFFQNHEDVWSKWVEPDVAAKIRSHL
ncbi:glycine betaine ABC transporter substrate-binding protein [Neorhizobium sp. NPDC001467]|uniref:glycine betaine ABC transporter substrate-binding protein n=1 Tax=Neorhizobium sp. NPDC001467 TaxID=3390595 RepID=UPI003D00A2D5